MNVARLNYWLISAASILLLVTLSEAQSPVSQTAYTITAQTNLAQLPEADTVIYLSPQKIFNEVAPKVVEPTELAKMRATFVDFKRNIGIDPASVEYIAIAVRFNKPTADLKFAAPDLLAVASGDFGADSLIEMATSFLQEKARTEKYGSKTFTIIKIDPIAEEAAKNPLLSPFAEVGVVALNSNTIALGNIAYLKSAVDAAEGNHRLSSMTIASLLRDPNTVISAAGSPLTAFAKSFGLLGTQAVARDPRCDTKFGDFYAAVTMEGTNFSLRGAMNADNPDTAKIINGLVSGMFQQAVNYIPDKETQSVLKNIRIVPKESEVIFEADVPQTTVAAFIREQSQPKIIPVREVPKPPTKAKRRVRRKKM
jgi:hypothetical protein